MTPIPSDTPVRRHERVTCRLPARARIASGDRDRVRLSPAVCDAEGWFGAELVDLSRGGAGLRAPIFLPRGVRVDVLVSCPAGRLEASARVQRTRMTDIVPTYLVGVSFDGADAGAPGGVGALLSALIAGEAGGERAVA